LIHLGRRRFFPPGGEDLYRQVAILTGMGPGVEVLDVGCGTGVVLEYLVREHGVQGTGVESDPVLVSRVREHFKESGMGSEVTLQEASPADLPFRSATFDVALGGVGLAASASPEDAVRELVRVVRPGGRVVLIQLVWKSAVDEPRKGILTEYLGARPLMTVEIRRLLQAAGVQDVHIEDWTEGGPGSRTRSRKPFPDFAEAFTLGEKLGILRKARTRWGWRGVRAVFRREMEVHRFLTRERALGLSLLVGKKEAVPTTGESADGGDGSSGEG
jgi:ubiquinone/menaquinone biosynthesis C-methylase UbiE